MIKPDPYATRFHRRIDIVLVVLTVVLIAFAFRYSAHSRTNSAAIDDRMPFAQESACK